MSSERSLEELEHMCITSAKRRGCNYDNPNFKRPDKSEELQRLLNERRLCRDAGRRKACFQGVKPVSRGNIGN